MADYYPLLARAISSLPQNNAEARKAVFDRARTALLRQLRGVDPPLPEGEITRERLALEEAIRRLEAEATPQDNVPDNAPAEEPVAEAAPSEPVAAPDAAPPAETAPETPAPETPVAEPPAEPAGEPEPASEPVAETADDEAPVRRPALRRGEVRSREAAKDSARDAGKDAGRDAGKPVRPSVRNTEPRQGASWKRFALWAVVAVVILAGIAFAVVGRGLLSDSHEAGGSVPVIGQSGPAEQPKSEDRMSASGGDAAARRAPAPAPTRTTGTQRAVLLEESPGGTSPPQTFEGTVTWKTETFNAGPGLPPDIGVRGEITIPERQITMSFVLRRNQDQTLPASHTIEVSFKLPQDFALGGIASVPGVRVKQSQQAQGVPLAGLSVRVNPTLFLVGLSPAGSDRQRNVALLQVYPWLDVPVVYTNNKRAVFVFEKGPTGDQAFNDAFSAWGELLQTPPQGQPAEPPAEPQQNAN